ncbi:uncharacterized protein PAC_18002 [Phialocephala subalpina]|uniref:Cytochrome P450 n=1 Tax=Phialocephala subalpina TaxID=576137 RepID=A0A1L7XSU7_9HELO|nr:uncharacterized protein PAC_18002 [Phialocephala subalpina]
MTLLDSESFAELWSNKWRLVLWAAVVYLSYKVVYAKFLSHTARVPGALIDKICGIRWFVSGLTGQKMYFVDRQVRTYGTLVEVAPNKLACASSDAVKTIYGSHEWKKSHFYSDFADFNGTPSLFSETDPIRATMLRRCFLPAFSRANLVAMSKNIFMHLEKFISKLEEFERQGRPLDTYRWFRYLTFEVVTDIGFGAEYDMISHGEIDHPFVNDFDDSVAWGILKSFLGPVIERIPVSWFPRSIREWQLAEVRTERHARGGLDKWREQKDQGIAGHRVDILQRLVEHGEKNAEDRLTEKELVTEIMEIMYEPAQNSSDTTVILTHFTRLAGGDTTASTVTYACYELTRFPEVQRKLRQALRDAIPDTSVPITVETLEAIPYLDWTVKEMLRMHPTLPSSLERVVPANGAEIAGHQLKGGTIVCMQAFTQHRQEAIFPNPEEFEPERREMFLCPNNENLKIHFADAVSQSRWAVNATAIMKANLLAFSSGVRSCVGQNLATMQMKIHMGMILRKYRIEGHPDTNPHSMEPLDFFQGKPRAGKSNGYTLDVTVQWRY